MDLSHIESTTPTYPQHSCTEEHKATSSSQEHEMKGGGGGYAHSIAQHQPTVVKHKPRYDTITITQHTTTSVNGYTATNLFFSVTHILITYPIVNNKHPPLINTPFPYPPPPHTRTQTPQISPTTPDTTSPTYY